MDTASAHRQVAIGGKDSSPAQNRTRKALLRRLGCHSLIWASLGLFYALLRDSEPRTANAELIYNVAMEHSAGEEATATHAAATGTLEADMRTKGPVPASLVPGILLASTILGAYACWGRTTQPSLETERAAAVSTFVAVLVFAAFCLGLRRWLALPVAVWGVAALGITHAYTVARPVRLFYTADAQNRVAYAKARLAEMNRQAADVAFWRAGVLPSRSMPCGVSGYDVRYPTGLPFGIRSYGSSYSVVSYSGPAGSNRPAWERFGEGWAGVLPERRKRVEAELAAYGAGLAEPPKSAAEEVPSWALESAELSAVLLVFNWVTLAVGSLMGVFSRQVRLLAESATMLA